MDAEIQLSLCCAGREQVMENTFIYLLGHYGVGKLTTAEAICAKTGAVLFDNHLVNNVIFSLVRIDGKTPVPEAVWDFVWVVREQAVEAIAELAPEGRSYVLTNALKDDERDRAAYQQIVDLAARRGATFVPVELECSDEENARRIVDPGREVRLKFTDAAIALERKRTAAAIPVSHENLLKLDNTDLSPDEAVEKILAHVESLKS